ncbi:MAG TPA: ABC transporter substrate-binding protein [Acidobacteriota bacterium]|nr:ABC transporter substrate-binding protein [Acidobacteriota bacterium]
MMRNYRNQVGKLGVLLSLLLLATAQACQPTPEAVYIGAVDNTGTKLAIELAVEQINTAGGINGAELRVIFASAPQGQSIAHQAVAIADELATDPRIVAVVGHENSTESLPAAHVYNRNGVVNIVPGSSNPLITDVGPWIFRLSINDELHGKFLADVAIEKLQFDDIAVLFTNNDYGKMLVNAFMNQFRQKGGQISYVAFFEVNDTGIVARISEQIIDADIRQIFFIGTIPDITAMLRRFDEADFTATVLSSDTTFSVNWSGPIAATRGKSRVFSSTFYNPLLQSTANINFMEAFSKKYGREPEPNDALFYDSVNLLAEAIKNSGATRESVREYIVGVGTKTQPFEGASGTISFTHGGNNRRPVSILEHGDVLSVFESRVIPDAQSSEPASDR